MRLGGSIMEQFANPDEWIQLLGQEGYTAAYFPVERSGEEAQEYAKAAVAADIVIAEVGAWSNPLAEEETERKKAIALCQERLALADQVGARCCVNVSGSLSSKWDGPHPDNLTPHTFDAVVESVRTIIDAVDPVRTYYTLEPMPWMYPDSADSYLALLKAVNRSRFAVHFDPVNLVCSPQLYYQNAAMIRDFVRKLGPHIKSCHAKDILIRESLTVHLDEVRPGLGELDYRTLLTELAKLDPDTPLMIEHLQAKQEYVAAGQYIRSVAAQLDIDMSVEGKN